MEFEIQFKNFSFFKKTNVNIQFEKFKNFVEV